MAKEIKRFFVGAEKGSYREVSVNVPVNFFSEKEEEIMVACGMEFSFRC